VELWYHDRTWSDAWQGCVSCFPRSILGWPAQVRPFCSLGYVVMSRCGCVPCLARELDEGSLLSFSLLFRSRHSDRVAPHQIGELAKRGG